ncbi:MAG: M3 family metallopeptidase, partial [Dehalococcoidia bacterium]
MIIPGAGSDATPPFFDYTTATPDSVRAGGEAAIERVEGILDGIVGVSAGARTFANTVLPLDEVRATLALAGGQHGFLANVAPDDALREEARAVEQRLDTYASSIGFRADLFAAVRDYSQTDEAAALGPLQARYLAHVLRDFRRNGFLLGEDERARVQAMKERLIALGVEFRRHIDESEDALWLSREELAGLPPAYIQRLQRREVAGGTHYRVSLEYPEFYPFMDAAEREDLRRDLFVLNANKAAAENLPILEEALALRHDIAQTLGYESWAHYAIETRMAETPERALAFLEDLEQRVREKADRDIEELTASKRAHTGDADARLEIWDWRFYQQRVMREQYAVDQFAVAEYFPLDATLDGMFGLYQRLVGVRFKEVADARAWHPDVRLFNVADAGSGMHLGAFYIDLHPRPDKYGHAAAFTLRPGRLGADGAYETGVSAMVANFTKPTSDSPSLLRHSEVNTLFHEFGHILHQVLTRSPYARFAGTSVQRDFVEAPSQMLEHWAWDAGVLAGFTRHVASGEPLPADLLHRMIAAKNVASGLHYLRQLYFARLDLAYHEEGRRKDTDAIAETLHGITGFPFTADTHFQAGFGHLFGYDAGYYGYLWSQVYGDDMAARIAEDPAGDEVV